MSSIAFRGVLDRRYHLYIADYPCHPTLRKTTVPTDHVPVPIELLQQEIRRCRRCEIDGFPMSPPPLTGGRAPAPFVVVGQAPSLSDLRNERMYTGPAGRKLLGWLFDAGFTEADMGETVYLTALTLCFPGRLPGKSTDRAPSARERANCRPWLTSVLDAIAPRVIIPFGKMAIDTFLPKTSLDESIGKVFEIDGITYVPLPHSSGASTWLNSREHQELLARAIEELRLVRERILGTRRDESII